MVVSFRMPEAWRGKVSDQQLVTWLREYALQRPALPADPGTGPFRRSFRLSDKDRRLMEHVAGGDVSSFLRRLIAFHLGSPGAVPARREERAVSSLRSPVTPSVAKQDRIAAGSPRLAENHHAAPPPLLSQPCEENGYSPMWRDGQWIRMARTPEEERVYGEFIDARLREDQRRKHA